MLKMNRPANRDAAGDVVVDKSVQYEIEVIPIRNIRPNPYQPRKVFSDEGLQELSMSIRQYGLLQPINVRKMNHNYYELISGERRLRASRVAGFTHIKAVVQPAIEQDSAIIALIENLQRENLHFFEEAEGYVNLLKDHGFTQEELARRIGKSQSTIANKLRILKLPRKIKEMIIAGKLTERHARALLRLHNEEAQIKLINYIRKNSLSVKMTEQLVEKTLRKIYGEIPDEKRNQRVVCLMRDYRIYMNTIKKAYNKIINTGIKGDFSVNETNKKYAIHIELIK